MGVRLHYKELALSMQDEPQKSYQNFDILIDQAEGNEQYLISVLQSPSGETTTASSVKPLADSDLWQRWTAKLRQGTIERDELAQLGSRLAEFLLSAGPIRDLYQRNRTLVIDAQGQRLRIRLSVIPPRLNILPWEYLCEGEHNALALDERISIVRYPRQASVTRSLTRAMPVSILLIVFNVIGQAQLNVIKEVRNLTNALRDLARNKHVTVDVLVHGTDDERQTLATLLEGRAGIRLLPEPARVDSFLDALRQDYAIVHYIGHGGFDPERGGVLWFADEAGSGRMLDAATLAQLLRGNNVGLIVLNACDSATEDTSRSFMGLGSSLIEAEIPAVIAIQYPIFDVSSICFSRTLYKALAEGLAIDAAVSAGRKALYAQEEPFQIEWGKPVLFMRAVDGTIWQPATSGHVDEQAEAKRSGPVFNTTVTGNSNVGQVINIDKLDGGGLTITNKQ